MKMIKIRKFLFIALLVLCSSLVYASSPISARLVSLSKVWDQSVHNAFPAIYKYDGYYFIAFREGTSHASLQGKIRILRSQDMVYWDHVALMLMDNYDLRDAQLLEAPDGRLMVLGGVAPRDISGQAAPTGTFTAFSEDGINWTNPEIVVQPGRWLWRATEHEGILYGVSYPVTDDRPDVHLLSSFDGRQWQVCVDPMVQAGSEGIIRFDDDQDETAYCVLRSNLLGKSPYPYKEWTWTTLMGVNAIEGPDFLKSPDGHWIAGGRHRDLSGVNKGCAVFYLNVETSELTPILSLPNGGDNGYASMLFDEQGYLWVCYYSSHEGNTSIYLAKVEITNEVVEPEVTTIIAETKGQANPIDNGFKLSATPQGAYIVGGGNDGEDYWSIQTAQRYAYQHDLTIADANDVTGWTATWRMKCIDNGAFKNVTDNMFHLRDGKSRWDLAAMPAIVGYNAGFYMLSKTVGWWRLDTLYPVDVTQYHTYQIVYDPQGNAGNGSAVYAVDGRIYTEPPIVRTELYDGAAYAPNICFGDQGTANNGTTEVRYSLVRFEKGQKLIRFLSTDIGQVSEAGTVSNYQVQIIGNPASTVSLTISGGSQLLINGSPQAVLTFNPALGLTPQTVTVAAVDDSIIEATHTGTISYQTSSLDPGYDNMAIASASVQILDNELATVAPLYVVPSNIIAEVIEGDSASYTVVLSTQPTSQVTVTFNADSQIAMQAGLVFTTSNWNVPQSVSMTAVEDSIGQGHRVATVLYTVSSADARFNNTFVPRMALTILDDEDFCGFNRPVYMPQDLNKDCSVDILDFAQLAGDWTLCSHPFDTENCICPCGMD